MNVPTSGTPTLCRRCGQISPGSAGPCPHCGSPLTGAPARSPAVQRAPILNGSVHHFEPARVTSGPELNLNLSRRTWQRIGAGGAVLVLALIAFLVLRPAPPSPAGTVEQYFEHLAAGDTAAALALADMSFATERAPLLIPAALAAEADRPADLAVKSTQDLTGDGRYSVVTASYRIGEQTLEQDFAVSETGDEETPYRLEDPFLYLAVRLPEGMDLTVNGISVGASRGTPVLPGRYTAATTGNSLFAGASRTAVYETGQRGTTAEIDLATLEIAPGAAAAVQETVERYLDTNCVNPQGFTASYRCPLQAPSLAWSQTTTWTVTTAPQLQLTPAESGRSAVRFSTATAGAAAYTTTYTEFGGAEKSESGTVPIDISGSAAIGDDGAMRIALGY